MALLVELDSLEITVIVDNELDVMSAPAPDTVQAHGMLGNIATESPHHVNDRGEASAELRMDQICCSAHGLSVLVVGLGYAKTPLKLHGGYASNFHFRQPSREMSGGQFSSILGQKRIFGPEIPNGYNQIWRLSRESSSRTGTVTILVRHILMVPESQF